MITLPFNVICKLECALVMTCACAMSCGLLWALQKTQATREQQAQRTSTVAARQADAALRTSPLQAIADRVRACGRRHFRWLSRAGWR